VSWHSKVSSTIREFSQSLTPRTYFSAIEPPYFLLENVVLPRSALVQQSNSQCTTETETAINTQDFKPIVLLSLLEVRLGVDLTPTLKRCSIDCTRAESPFIVPTEKGIFSFRLSQFSQRDTPKRFFQSRQT
jgi:hypothetical protein